MSIADARRASRCRPFWFTGITASMAMTIVGGIACNVELALSDGWPLHETDATIALILFNIMIISALAVTSTAFLLILLMWVLEQTALIFQTLPAWAMGGFVVSVPLALFGWHVAYISACDSGCFDMQATRQAIATVHYALIIVGFGALGGAVAWIVRYRGLA